MNTSEISIKGRDGNFMGYLSEPGYKAPGVIVIQEIFGVNTWLRSVCDMFAENGFAAMAPDLFWRIEPNIQLDATIEAEFNKGLEIYGKFNVDKGVEDIQDSINHLRKIDACSGKVGSTGFCLGGLLAFLTSARTDVNSSSGYYGVGIDGVISESENIKSPTILHFAEEDGFVPKETAEKICTALENHQMITTYNYPGCDHGFTRDTDATHYNKEATQLAHSRTLSLFKESLS